MASERRRSRRRGEGSVTAYSTKAGTRYRFQIRVPLDPGDPTAKGTKLVGRAGFLDENTATRAMIDLLQDSAQGAPMPDERGLTVLQYANRWHAALPRDEYAASTLAGYERIIRLHIGPHLGRIRLDKLTPRRVATFYNELRDGGKVGGPLSPNTVAKVATLLSTVMGAAVDDGHIRVNPARRSKVVRPPSGKAIRAAQAEMVTWTAQQLSAFLTWNADEYVDELHALWRLIAHTGMRRSEALALRWSDLDVKGRRVSVRRAVDTTKRDATKPPKSGKPRVIDLDDTTVQVLKSHKALRGSLSLDLARPGAYIFGLLDGRLRKPADISKAWTIRVRRAQGVIDGLPALTIHGLRHTHATLLLETGEHPRIVQERLGHANITVTMGTYSHVTPTMQRAAVDRFSALVDGTN